MHGHGRGAAVRGAPRAAKTLLGPAKALLSRARVAPRTPLLGREAGPLREIETKVLCEQVRERLEGRAAAKGVEVLHRCSRTHVRVQPAPFAEALYELTHNAVEAAVPGHPVVVSVSNTPEGDVLWQIDDHGEGMSVHDLRRLGLPQLSSGLGVMLAWAIVEHHGGLLHFESAPGGGTTASIWLPG